MLTTGWDVQEDMSSNVEDMPLKVAVITGVVSFVHVSNQKTRLEIASEVEGDAGQEGCVSDPLPLPPSLTDANGAIEASTPAQGQSPVGARDRPGVCRVWGEAACLQPVLACDTVDCLDLDFGD
jgi:hypothetical protein